MIKAVKDNVDLFHKETRRGAAGLKSYKISVVKDLENAENGEEQFLHYESGHQFK